MHKHMLVCPFDKNLIGKIKDFTLVVRTNEVDDINLINDVVNKDGRLHCIIIEKEYNNLSSVAFNEGWSNIPLIFHLSSLGNFKDFYEILPLLRMLNLRIYFPLSKKNIESIQIVSSLMINSGVIFPDEIEDWESIIDIMTYAIYSKARHSEIEPFNYIVSHYDPQILLNYSTVYFENHNRYLHIDKDINIALSKKDLDNKLFISNGLENIESIEDNVKYIDRTIEWQKHFLPPDECASCPAWRICLGKFSQIEDKENKCKKLFSEILDASDYHRTLKKENKEIKLCQL